METKNFDICIKDGMRYRKYKNRLHKLCQFEECIHLPIKETNYKYCNIHKTHCILSNEEQEKIRDKIKKSKMNELEKSKNLVIINEKEIFIIKGLKYRKTPCGRFKPICPFNNCTNLICSGTGGYCANHIHGSSPSDPDRIKQEEDKRKSIAILSKNKIAIGNEAEEWICNILETLDNITNVERISHLRNRLDIIYKCFDENFYRGVQVKTLIYRNENKFTMNFHNQPYDDDTLFLGINKNRDRFVIFTYIQKQKDKYYNFNNKNSKYINEMFINIDEFKIKLKEMVVNSSIYNPNNVSNEIKKEFDSINRLKEMCQQLGLNFQYNKTHNSVIDCFINNNKIQCKSSSYRLFNRYQFSCSKRGEKNGKNTNIPYEENDVDFFIFEIIDDPNNFYIIPIQNMIDQGFIKTDENKDKIKVRKFYIPIKDLELSWIAEYFNNFDPFFN